MPGRRTKKDHGDVSCVAAQTLRRTPSDGKLATAPVRHSARCTNIPRPCCPVSLVYPARHGGLTVEGGRGMVLGMTYGPWTMDHGPWTDAMPVSCQRRVNTQMRVVGTRAWAVMKSVVDTNGQNRTDRLNGTLVALHGSIPCATSKTLIGSERWAIDSAVFSGWHGSVLA